MNNSKFKSNNPKFESNSLKIAVIGIGNMGSAHAQSIYNKNIKGLELIAVCDIDKSKLDWATENLKGIKYYNDYKELIKDKIIDAVLIATPHYLHTEIAIYSFENGLNVLTEKPAGVYTKQVELMNEVALKSNKVFCIMYNQRTNPLFKKAHDIVKQGSLGQLKRCVWIVTNWYRSQAYYDSGTWRATWAGEGGGVLLNQCPHNIDIWQWILGMPSRIRGFCSYGKYHNIEVEDDVTAYAEYANGGTAVFITTTGETPGTNRLEISGDKGKIVIEDNKMKFWQLETSEREFCFETKKGFDTPKLNYSEIVFDDNGAGHNGILQNFTNSILYGEKLIAPGEEGINGLTISNAISLSSWIDDWVTIPIDKELYYKLLKEKIASSNTKENIMTQTQNLGKYNDRWNIKW